MSDTAGRRFVLLDAVGEAEKVALYRATRNEVDCVWVFHELRRRGKRTCFPRTVKEKIEFVEVSDLTTMVEGRWGIQEPKEGRVMPLGEIDLVVVPGIVFDEAGHRIGFGQGYYDRALEGCEGVKVGLAYDFQVLPKIPCSAGDLRCDWIVTEKRTVAANR